MGSRKLPKSVGGISCCIVGRLIRMTMGRSVGTGADSVICDEECDVTIKTKQNMVSVGNSLFADLLGTFMCNDFLNANVLREGAVMKAKANDRLSHHELTAAKKRPSSPS